MTAEDFRRIALSFQGVEERSHMGSPDFRVAGRIFATLASEAQGFGNLKLTPEQQAGLVADAPEQFLPVAGSWGHMGMTHIRLAAVDEPTLRDALRLAWQQRIGKVKAVRKKMAGAD